MITSFEPSKTMDEIERIETLRQPLTLFVHVGMSARNLSLRTRAEYRHDLSNLIKWLEGQGISTLAAVSLQHLTGYQAEMDKRGYQPSTRSRKTHAIKSWFRFLYDQGVITDDVASRLIAPRAVKR